MNRCTRGSCGFAAFLVGMLLLAMPSRAAADPPAGDRESPSALRKAGAAAANAKNWVACIDAYSRAAEKEEDPNTFGELGLCEEAAGRFSSAHPHLKRALAGMAPGAARRDKYQAALERVAELVAVVIVTVTPTDARVVVDGHPVGEYDGRYVVVPPGRHVFAARKRGYKDALKSLTVNAGEFPNIELMLTELPKGDAAPSAELPRAASPAPAAPTRPAGPSVEPVSALSLPLPLGWCVPASSARGVLAPAACAGLVALAASGGTAVGLTVHSDSMRGSLAARGFTPTSCAAGAAASSAECAELFARQQQRDTAQDVLIGTTIATGALVGAAAVAIALEHPNPRITVHASATGGGIVLQGTW